MEFLPYADGSGYEARFSRCGICTLMKVLGLYDGAGGFAVHGCVPVGHIAVRPSVCGNTAARQGQVAHPDKFFVGFFHAVRRGDRVNVEKRSRAEADHIDVVCEQGISYGELVVDLVGGIGIEKEFLRPVFRDAGENGSAVFVCHAVLLL